MIFFSFIFCINLTQYILTFIKFFYTKNIIKKESRNVWFYKFDIALIVILSILSLLNMSSYLLLILEIKDTNCYITIILNKINGINIENYELPSEFKYLDEKEKNKLIFKKYKMKSYEYKLKDNHINLIKEINDIRKQYNVQELKYDTNQKLPEFIINEKTIISLNKSENIYKLSSAYYIFKYQKNEFQNYFNNKEILNIITIDYLKEINIIEQNNYELITIYNNEIPHTNIIKTNNINNNRQNISINVKLPDIDNPNTDDRLNNNMDITGINDE